MSATTFFALALLAPAAAPPGPRVDAFGDPLPAGAIVRMGSTRLRSGEQFNVVAFTPDGKSLVSAGHRRRVAFWDVETGREKTVVTLPETTTVSTLSFSAAGDLLALACSGSNAAVRLLDGKTGAERKVLRPSEWASESVAAHLSPDGKTLLVNNLSRRQLLLWDTDSGEVRHQINNIGGHGGTAFAFLPDGKHFLTQWTDGKLHLVSTADGKSVRDLEPGVGVVKGLIATRIAALGVSPDGKQVVVRHIEDRAYRLIDLATGKVERNWQSPNDQVLYTPGALLAFLPDGKHLVECDGALAFHVWDVKAARRIRSIPTPWGVTSQVALSRDGKLVASGVGGVLVIHDVATGKPLHAERGHQHYLQRLAFTPDGKRLVSMGRRTIRLWDADSGKPLHQGQLSIANDVVHVTARAESARWIAGLGVYRWKYDQRETERVTDPRTLPEGDARAVSPDGKHLACIDPRERKLRLSELPRGKSERILAAMGNRGRARLTFSPDGELLALATAADRVVTLYEIPEGVGVRSLLPSPINPTFTDTPRIQISPDSRAALVYDGHLRIMEVGTGGQRLRLQRESVHPQLLAWSDNGRLFARAYRDGVVVVHDAITGKELMRQDTGQGSLYALAFCPDGRRLATGGDDTTILVWPIPEPARPTPEFVALDGAWKDLVEIDAQLGYRGMAYFIGQPKEAVATFAARVRTKSAADTTRIAKLIKDLDDDAFDVRENASEELESMGTEARAALQTALKDPPSLEVKRRCEMLLRKIKSAAVTSERLRAMRAVEVLERIGSLEAKQTLRGLLKQKPSPTVESAIRGSLRRMGEE